MHTELYSDVVAICNASVDTLVVAVCNTKVVNCYHHVETLCTRNCTLWLLPCVRHRQLMLPYKSVSNLRSDRRVLLAITYVHTKLYTLVVAIHNALVDTFIVAICETSVVNCYLMHQCPVTSLRSHHQKSQINHM